MPVVEVPAVECYPILAKKKGVDTAEFAQGSPLPAAFWDLHLVGGAG